MLKFSMVLYDGRFVSEQLSGPTLYRLNCVPKLSAGAIRANCAHHFIARMAYINA